MPFVHHAAKYCGTYIHVGQEGRRTRNPKQPSKNAREILMFPGAGRSPTTACYRTNMVHTRSPPAPEQRHFSCRRRSRENRLGCFGYVVPRCQHVFTTDFGFCSHLAPTAVGVEERLATNRNERGCPCRRQGTRDKNETRANVLIVQ